MILQRLKQHLLSVHCIERSVLARQFKLSDDGIDAMLEIWVKKGRLKRSAVNGCAGCSSCGEQSSEVIYQWIKQDKSVEIEIVHRAIALKYLQDF